LLIVSKKCADKQGI